MRQRAWKEMTNVRPKSSSWSLIAAGGAGVDAGTKTAGGGYRGACSLFASASHYLLIEVLMYRILTSITRRGSRLRIFLLSGDTATCIYLLIGMHP
jgi:hypothetical protein